MKSGLFVWARSWVSALLVALAALLLAVAQRVDEEPVAYLLRELVVELAKGLEEPMKPLGRLDGVYLAEGEVKLKPGGVYVALPLAGDDNE